MLSGRQLLKATSVGVLLGGLPFTFFGLASGSLFGGISDPRRDVLVLLLRAAAGIGAAVSITVAHGRAVRRP